MRPRESPHSLDQYVNSQLPYIVRAAICTQPIVPQICKPPAAATRQNMPQQGQLSLGGTGQEFVGSFPISATPLSFLSPFMAHPSIHSFILTPGKHVTDARMRVPPRRPICRGSSEGWCSCDAAVTWRDAFPTSLRIKGRTSPCHVWNAPVHSGRGTGKSQAASCAM